MSKPTEVFYVAAGDLDPKGWYQEVGWYWFYVVDGYGLDGSANGPYPTRQQAEEAAREG